MNCQVNCDEGPCDEKKADEKGGICCIMCFETFMTNCSQYKECQEVTGKRKEKQKGEV